MITQKSFCFFILLKVPLPSQLIMIKKNIIASFCPLELLVRWNYFIINSIDTEAFQRPLVGELCL